MLKTYQFKTQCKDDWISYINWYYRYFQE